MKINLLFIGLICIVFIGCKQQINCEQFPTEFKSYSEAIEKIKSTNFKIEEDVNTSKSSWISGASFYSCDGNQGFFILETKDNEYLYLGLPYSVWKEFKSANSFGKFYNERIKHHYIFYLSK